MNNKKEKIKVSEEERLRRKDLGLPVTKALRYMLSSAKGYVEKAVKDYEVEETLEPSGTRVLLVTLEDGEQRRVLSSYFVDMQKPSFVEDVSKVNFEE